jgi:cystathionine gamma-synthase
MTRKPETHAVHSTPPNPLTGSIVPPLDFTTTFEYEATGDPHSGDGFTYTRNQNPNRATLEASMAQLEGGTKAHAVASGSAAMMAIFQGLSPGDHIISSADMYFGIRVQLNEFFAHWGLETTYVDMRDLDAVEVAFRPNTKLVIFESPTNPMIRLADIAAIGEITHRHGAQLLVDNTVATPIAQNPLQLGADIVVISLTKYIAGHHDVLGVLLYSRQRITMPSALSELSKSGELYYHR